MIKEFKNLMNEKSQARNIKCLKRTVILLGLSLILLSSVELAFKMLQNTDVDNGEQIIFNAYLRANLLGDVIFYCRMLDLLGRGIYIPRNKVTIDEAEIKFKNKLSDYVNRLQENQFNVIKGRIKMDQKKNPPAEKLYNITFMLQND
jgi:hypothetical protein